MAHAASRELWDVLRERRLVVCVGSGGVGKTTTAAALALQAAIAGRRTVVVTIDPAKRLANSLGLEALGNEERPITPEKFGQHGITPRGSLHAMMLDTRKTFDELIRRVAPDPETRERVLANGVYRHISDTLSASHDYMASEKLYDLYSGGRYDLIVLDTPPMKNAIDFLEAPGRLSRFLDDKIVSWFLKPHEDERRRGPALLAGASGLIYRLLEPIFGHDFLDEIADFFLASRDLLHGFRERADVVSDLLRNTALTRFVVVCTPSSTSMEEARYFHRELLDRAMPGGFFVVNQVGPWAGARRGADGNYLDDGARNWLRAQIGDGTAAGRRGRSLVERLESHYDRSVALSEDDRRAVSGLRSFAGSRSHVCVVPRMPDDIYDFDGLLAIDRALFAGKTQGVITS